MFRQVAPEQRPKVAFFVYRARAQYAGMGRQLYETQPTFRDAIDRCDEILSPQIKRSLVALLFSQDGDGLDQTANTQPALFALEYALTELWQSWGVIPDVVMGHSVGEVVAACVAGVFSLKDGLKLIAERGRLMQALPQDGDMVASKRINTKCKPQCLVPCRNHIGKRSPSRRLMGHKMW